MHVHAALNYFNLSQRSVANSAAYKIRAILCSNAIPFFVGVHVRFKAMNMQSRGTEGFLTKQNSLGCTEN